MKCYTAVLKIILLQNITFWMCYMLYMMVYIHLTGNFNVNMNITNFDGYITIHVKWPEVYIPWHVELFGCHVNCYIPHYILGPPPNPLACWFAANWKQNVFTYPSSARQTASTISERPAGQWQHPGNGLLLCLLPVRGLKLGQLQPSQSLTQWRVLISSPT